MAMQMPKAEHGAALIIALLLLTILTIIGLSGMTSSVFELRMAGNTQDFYDSFQSADAGISATMALSNDVGDPFVGGDEGDVIDPSSDLSAPLSKVKGVAVDVKLILTNVECPRAEDGSSTDLLDCEYYRVNSAHENANTGARTRLHQGVGKELIDASGG